MDSHRDASMQEERQLIPAPFKMWAGVKGFYFRVSGPFTSVAEPEQLEP
jgi:hypothetical protein